MGDKLLTIVGEGIGWAIFSALIIGVVLDTLPGGDLEPRHFRDLALLGFAGGTIYGTMRQCRDRRDDESA